MKTKTPPYNNFWLVVSAIALAVLMVASGLVTDSEAVEFREYLFTSFTAST